MKFNRRITSAALAAVLLCSQVGGYASAEEDFTYSGEELIQAEVSKYAPAQVELVKTTSNFSAGRVFWKQIDCDGYEILIKEHGSWRHAGWSAADKSNKLIRGLKKGKTYAFRVRAYNKVNGKKYFGKKSAALRFRTKGYKEKIDGIVYIDGIMIANKTYKLPKDYNPGGLTADTLKAYNKMRSAASKDNIYITCISGFRSYETQKALYESYVRRDGKAAADRDCARPGYSEHQTGMAMDINNASGWFTGTKEAKWLAKHCCEYGFILRYPEGKEDITGYKYESWHISYIGSKKLATKLTKEGLTLEEYFGITSKYRKG